MEPDTPSLRMQNHIRASVDVLVSLDAAGHVVGATIERSGVAVVNDAALAAARGSTYQPALHDCKPVSGHIHVQGRVQFAVTRARHD